MKKLLKLTQTAYRATRCSTMPEATSLTLISQNINTAE